jgi:PAT family beta-lactamase induction signal transducer AmpG
LDIGYSKSEIGVIVKLLGFWATIAGSLIGGVMTLRIGIYGGLWIFGILQAISTAFFAALTHTGHSIVALSAVIGFENLSSGMGTVAFVAFMAILTDKRFTATQYALLTSLMGVPRVLASAPTGYFIKYLGWENFFIACSLMAIPGLLLLFKAKSWGVASSKIIENL